MNSSHFVKKTLKFFNTINLDFIKKMYVYDNISSTNRKAKEFAQKGVEEGTIVIAKYQIKGRGRFDRVWESPEGGMYLSIILRPSCSPDKTTILPLLSSLVVSETINMYTLSSNIKWPNDVFVHEKKIAGILLESEVIKNKVQYVILGIGINLNTDIRRLSKEIKVRSTSVSEELGICIDYYLFLKHLLNNFNKYYKIFCKEDYTTIITNWKLLSDTIGKRITIKTINKQVTGKAIDIDQSGFLILKINHEKFKKITNGDCIYIEE
jgi:BirA family biotin operon repressor/biotin-[acetyl-CoA-carboxylase] ligase